MKRIVIVDYRGTQLANKLWSHMSIVAMGLELQVPVYDLTTFAPILSRMLGWYSRSRGAMWATAAPKLLPPSVEWKFADAPTLYMFGWTFRNPVGMRKHRPALIEYFAPTPAMAANVNTALASYVGKVLIGVCRRTTPYPGFPDGQYLMSKERMQAVCKEYLHECGLSEDDTAIVEVNTETQKSLWLLARCSVVIGDNSTFANVAAYVANAPHVVVTEEPIDWAYYAGKKGYFDNRYATFAYGSLKP